MASKKYAEFVQKMQNMADLGQAMAVLGWDKEVNLPKGSSQRRGQQMATLSALVHGKFVDPEFGSLIDQLSKTKNLSKKERRNVEITKDEYEKATLFSEEFVIKKSIAISNLYAAWIEAREKDDFEIYAEPLDKMLDIVREESRLLNRGEHPYDSHLDRYEPNLTVAKVDKIFEEVAEFLPPLLKTLSKAKTPKDGFLFQKFSKSKQWDFGIEILKSMGYDFNYGRQDISPHPFTTSFGPEDVRVTTRIDENDFKNMTWSTIHEGGHALYEQGLDASEYGLPSGSPISLAIHESQSRLWENHVGRSKDFWIYFYPILQKKFRKQLQNTSLKKFYKAINKVQPNLIRTEADELHYHLHVLIRYQLEKTIFEENINAQDIRRLWNEKYREYLGLSVSDDKNGVLQDVHWAHGSFGYFPTYSLGSFYAAQFYAQAQKDIPKLQSQIKNGDSSQLLSWLRENIHSKGRTVEADELCKNITGEYLNFDYFKEYAETKFLDLI